MTCSNFLSASLYFQMLVRPLTVRLKRIVFPASAQTTLSAIPGISPKWFPVFLAISSSWARNPSSEETGSARDDQQVAAVGVRQDSVDGKRGDAEAVYFLGIQTGFSRAENVLGSSDSV